MPMAKLDDEEREVIASVALKPSDLRCGLPTIDRVDDAAARGRVPRNKTPWCLLHAPAGPARGVRLVQHITRRRRVLLHLPVLAWDVGAADQPWPWIDRFFTSRVDHSRQGQADISCCRPA